MRHGWAISPRGEYPPDWKAIATRCKEAVGWQCIRCRAYHDVRSGHVLTIHHANGDKSDCRWWNLLALCQRCHLKIQAKVNLDRPYPLVHSKWFQPYVAGWYAFKYLGQELNREEVMNRLDELLALECQGKQGVLL